MANCLDGDQARTLRRLAAEPNRTEPKHPTDELFQSRIRQQDEAAAGSRQGAQGRRPPARELANRSRTEAKSESLLSPEALVVLLQCRRSSRVGDGRTSLSAPTHLLEDTQASTQRLTMLTRMPIPLQASEDVSKYLFQMKVLLYGDGGEASSSQETLLETLMANFFSLVVQRTSLNRRSLLSSRKRSTRMTCCNCSCRTSGGSSSRCALCVVRDSALLLLTRKVGLHTGTQGRLADLQQPAPTTNRDSMADSRTLERKGRNHLCCAPGVRSLLPRKDDATRGKGLTRSEMRAGTRTPTSRSTRA